MEEQWRSEQQKTSSWWYWSPISFTFPSNVIANLQVSDGPVVAEVSDGPVVAEVKTTTTTKCTKGTRLLLKNVYDELSLCAWFGLALCMG